jgi:hypothetical protein
VLFGKFLEHRGACLVGAVSALDEMEKTGTEKMGKISEAQNNMDGVEVLGGRFQYSRPRVFFIDQSRTPSASTLTPTHILPTTDQIEGSANTHGHDEECRQAK